MDPSEPPSLRRRANRDEDPLGLRTPSDAVDGRITAPITYVCRFCERIFSGLEDVSEHMEAHDRRKSFEMVRAKVHGRQRGHSCHICDLSLASMRGVRKHMAVHRIKDVQSAKSEGKPRDYVENGT
ncbi:unnamed protein product [Nezara viridula]|uniref:C2H2-type domain-containing protein n=1 Tax=Nezara viridula TaxID=85310 RepID=A0A9P0MQK0_NEZVI|nr:unnamed protein product [Nezara viridula]